MAKQASMRIGPDQRVGAPGSRKARACDLPVERQPVGPAWAAWDRNRRRTFFIYGGLWMAQLESPPGLRDNQLYGRSTNQAILNGSPRVTLRVDDYVFFRPTQSEKVLLEFGDILAVRGGRVEARWPVLPP